MIKKKEFSEMWEKQGWIDRDEICAILGMANAPTVIKKLKKMRLPHIVIPCESSENPESHARCLFYREHVEMIAKDKVATEKPSGNDQEIRLKKLEALINKIAQDLGVE
jgi:hypothetical protein